MFLGLTVLLYALVLFAPGDKTPKLGIDLQGGTRVVLQAQVPGGGTPAASSMSQARTIMETRVNGSGVSGVQVQVDGSDQLVVTAPGSANLTGLTRSARMNIREDLAQGPDIAAATAAASKASASATSSTTGTGSAVTNPAIGDTETSSTPAASGASQSGSTSAAKSGGQGLRGPAAALATGETTPSSSASSSAPTTPSSAAAPSASAGTTATVTPTATGTSAPAATWPLPGSDPSNPNQPAAKDKAGWAAWVTAATAAVNAGTIKCSDVAKTQGEDVPERPLLACGIGAWSPTTQASPCGPDVTDACVTLLDQTLVPGDQISTAAAVNDPAACGGWCINVSFKPDGFKTWSNYTANNVGKQTSFTLDGQVLSDPKVNQPITTVVTQVSGSFTQQSATALANSLKYGALPLQFKELTTETVSAQLGLDYLQAGLIAGGIGLALVVIYCLIYYRLLGVITILSLVLSFGLVYAVMVLLGRWIGLSLDMAGVAGLIVAIGITADSFVIYFERIKDEVREGRTFRSAVPRGWERAKRTILSADAVTFLSALVLYLIATGDVKGFAFTLGLSTILDLVVVFLVTHPLVAWASGAKIFSSPTLSGLGAVAKAGAARRALAAQLNVKEA